MRTLLTAGLAFVVVATWLGLAALPAGAGAWLQASVHRPALPTVDGGERKATAPTPAEARYAATILVPLAFAQHAAGASARPRAQVGGPFYLGAQTHLFWTDRPRSVALARAAGFAWLKQQVRWDAIEPRAKGVYEWRQLDAAVEAANAGGLRLLLSINAAPAWATGGNPIAGPPNDDQDFADFVRALAQRYRGRVHAYEIWNEQNLWYEWGGKGRMNAAHYVRLLRLAYGAIKAVDPEAIVVSGAPTPTGVNDGETAIDDLVYLEQMYAAGLREVADAVGAHPHGYNNPPDDWLDTRTVPSERFKGHPSFYFRRLEQYRLLMERQGDADRPIWITEVGWTTANQAPGYEYGNDISEEDQARYLVRAVVKARDEYPWVQALFVWNLNFATFTPPHDEKHPWSIVRADWSPRPAYRALQALPKGPRPALPPRPPTAARLAAIAPVGDCAWQITFVLEGFTPDAEVTVSSRGHYDACGADSGPYETPAAPAGRTDERGALVVSYRHPDFGSYTYVFTDSVGRTAEVAFSYAP